MAYTERNFWGRVAETFVCFYKRIQWRESQRGMGDAGVEWLDMQKRAYGFGNRLIRAINLIVHSFVGLSCL